MSSSSNNPLQINQLPVSFEIPKNSDLTEIISLLYRRISRAVNTKTGSLYDLQELGNFNQFFTPGTPFAYRPVYRYVFDLVAQNGGNIAGGATVNFVHNINGIKYAALIYASCTSAAGDLFTVVYPNATMTLTNVNFVNPLPATALTAAYLVGEYLKT